MFGKDPGNVKGAQRFLSNDSVELSQLREVLYACSLENLRRHQAKSVLCVFDPTLLDYSAQHWKQERMPIGDRDGLGYEWLNALLIEASGGRILGVVHQALHSLGGKDDDLDYLRDARKKKRRSKAFLEKQERNFKNTFLHIAEAADKRVPADVELIHVADRDFDDGLVLRSRRAAGSNRHFVIRGNANRIVQLRTPEWLPAECVLGRGQKNLDSNPEHLVDVHVKDVVEHVPCRFKRTLHLDNRGRVCREEVASQHASLEIGATPIRLGRASKRGELLGIEEEPVWLNLVVVREAEDSGRKTKTPIQWLLLTDLPIDTLEAIDRVVQLYRRRWRTEEFFRSEKDALQAERSELDDERATARLLVFTTLKAMFLDELRFRAEVPAGEKLPKELRRELRAAGNRARELEMARQKGTPIPRLTTKERGLMALGVIAYEGSWTGVSLGNYVLLRGLPVFIHDVSEGRYAWPVSDEDVG